jgi:hypothetical protein
LIKEHHIVDLLLLFTFAPFLQISAPTTNINYTLAKIVLHVKTGKPDTLKTQQMGGKTIISVVILYFTEIGQPVEL